MMGIKGTGYLRTSLSLALILGAGFSFAQTQPQSYGGCPAGHGGMPAGAGEAMNAAYIAQMQAMQEMMTQAHPMPGGGAGAGPVACPTGAPKPGHMPFDPQEMMNQMLEEMGFPLDAHPAESGSDCGCGGDASGALVDGVLLTTDDQGNTFPGHNGVPITTITLGTVGMGFYHNEIVQTATAFGGDGSSGAADHAALDLALDWLFDLYNPFHALDLVSFYAGITGLEELPVTGTESSQAAIPVEGVL